MSAYTADHSKIAKKWHRNGNDPARGRNGVKIQVGRTAAKCYKLLPIIMISGDGLSSTRLLEGPGNLALRY